MPNAPFDNIETRYLREYLAQLPMGPGSQVVGTDLTAVAGLFNNSQAAAIVEALTEAAIAPAIQASYADLPQAIAGIRNDLGMTPLGTREQIDNYAVPEYTPEMFRISGGDWETAFAEAYAAAQFDRASIRADGSYTMLPALKVLSGVKLHGKGTFYKDPLSSGRENAFFNVGTLGDGDQDAAIYTDAAMTLGPKPEVTFTTIGDAAGYAVGDYVMVRAGTYFETTGFDIYEWGSFNQVVSVDAATGKVGFLYPFDEYWASVGVTNLSAIPFSVIYPTEAPHYTTGVEISGINLLGRTSTKMFRDGGGSIGSRFAPGQVICDSFAYGNGFMGCSFGSDNVEFSRHYIELACYSQGNRLSVRAARMSSTPGDTAKRPIRLSGNCRDNDYYTGMLDMDVYTDATNPIYLAEGRRNKMRGDRVLARNAPSYIASFNSQAFGPTAPRCEDNEYSVKRTDGGSSIAYVLYNNAGGTNKGNSISGSPFYGAVSSGRAVDMTGERPIIKDSWFENGNLFRQAATTNEEVKNNYFPLGHNSPIECTRSGSYAGNSSNASRLVAAQNKLIGNQTVTSVVANNVFQTQTFAAGSLSANDTIEFEFSGSASGTAGSKDLVLRVGSNNVASISLLAAEIGQYHVRGRVFFTSATSIAWSFEVSSPAASAVRASAGGATIPTIASNSLVTELQAWKGDAADSLLLRFFEAKAVKAFR